MIEFGLHPHERVILVVRKHPLLVIGKLIPFAILDYLPYLLPWLANIGQAATPGAAIQWSQMFMFGNPWFDFIVGVYWLFVWMGAFGVFTDFFLDQWIITTERVVNINQKSFWSREVSSLFLNRVQDVETDITGVFQTLFGFGTVSVESAGVEAGRFKMHGLAKPRYIRDLILELVGKIHEKDTYPKTGV